MIARAAQLAGTVNHPSLRWRVSLWTGLIALLIQLVFGSLLFFYQRFALNEMFSHRLTGRSRQITDAVTRHLDLNAGAITDDALTEIASKELRFTVQEGFVVVLATSDWQPLAATSRPWPDNLLPEPFTRPIAPDTRSHAPPPPPEVERVSLSHFETGSASGVARRLLAIVQPDGRPSMRLIIAVTDNHYAQLLASFGRTLAVSMLLGVIATLVATWLIAGIALRPLRQLSDLVSSFTPQVIREEISVKRLPTELAGFQQELASVRAKLRESIRSQDRLIANLSHELKTPIAILLTEAQILNTQTMSPEMADFVRSVRQEMRRLGSSIATFTQLAKLQGEHSLPAPATHAVNDLVINAVADCGVVAARKNVSLRMEVAEDVHTPMVLGDAELLEAMYGHILQHCIRLSAKGDEVVVTVAARGDRCIVTITDRGPPIAPAFLASIFEHFHESPAECTDRRELRLSIAKGIAELHAGSIQVSNGPAGGCFFTIDLPRFIAPSKPER